MMEESDWRKALKELIAELAPNGQAQMYSDVRIARKLQKYGVVEMGPDKTKIYLH